MTDGKQSVSTPKAANILVIKLAALGDFIQAFGPFQAIRNTYPNAKICLLTTPSFGPLARQSGWFDEVLFDRRPKIYDLPGILALRQQLHRHRFDLVIDLQTSDRSSAYKKLFWPGNPLWSGIAREASHRHRNPNRNRMHTVDRQADQLAMLGIDSTKPVSMEWLTAGTRTFDDLSDRYALLLPGGAPHRPEKRWPAQGYAEVGTALAEQGVQPVVLGTSAEEREAAYILDKCPEALSLVGETGLADLAALASRAELAVGNDTGPMHLAAVCGCPSIVLFSHASDPDLCGPRGPRVTILQNDRIMDISVQQVVEAAEAIR